MCIYAYTYICTDHGWPCICRIHKYPCIFVHVLEHVQDRCINAYHVRMDGGTGGRVDGWIHLYMHPLMHVDVDVFNHLLSSVCCKLISTAPCQSECQGARLEGKNILCSNPNTHDSIRVQLMSTWGNQANI